VFLKIYAADLEKFKIRCIAAEARALARAEYFKVNCSALANARASDFLDILKQNLL
jgi:hypothetical protein